MENCGARTAEVRREAAEAIEALERDDAAQIKTGARKSRRVLVPIEAEEKWFCAFGETHPRQMRKDVVGITREAAEWRHPLLGARWREWCTELADEMAAGRFTDFIDRHDPSDWRETLSIFFELTRRPWPAGTLIRAASAEVAADSKWLDRRRARMERMLRSAVPAQWTTLSDLGLAEPARFCVAHGPIRLRIQDTWLDFGLLESPFAIGERDIAGAETMEVRCPRVLTVENETSFHQLAQLRSGEVIVQTSYPGAATLVFLRRLPLDCEFWHFGDSDPQGFDILRDLRERSGRPVRALFMQFRPRNDAPVLTIRERRLCEQLRHDTGFSADEVKALSLMLETGSKGDFEQERLKPTVTSWPFFTQ